MQQVRCQTACRCCPGSVAGQLSPFLTQQLALDAPALAAAAVPRSAGPVGGASQSDLTWSQPAAPAADCLRWLRAAALV
jgi:hypothetical protein